MKTRNFVAKHGLRINKYVKHVQRKRAAKNGYMKHKTKIYE